MGIREKSRFLNGFGFLWITPRIPIFGLSEWLESNRLYVIVHIYALI